MSSDAEGGGRLATQRRDGNPPQALKRHAVGLSAATVQSAALIAPAAGAVSSLAFIAGYSGAATPLAFVIGLVVCVAVALVIGEYAKRLPSAGSFYTYLNGRLVIFPTPGHAPGHQSLLVRLGQWALILAGDAAYDREKMEHRCLPGLLWNPDALIESWERIEKMQRRNNAQLINAQLIITHDLHWADTMRLAPDQWYE